MIDTKQIETLRLTTVKIEGLLAVLATRPDDKPALEALRDEYFDFASQCSALIDSAAEGPVEATVANPEVQTEVVAEIDSETGNDEPTEVETEVDTEQETEDLPEPDSDVEVDDVLDTEETPEVEIQSLDDAEVDAIEDDDAPDIEVVDEEPEVSDNSEIDMSADDNNFEPRVDYENVPDPTDQLRLDELFSRKSANDLRSAFTLNDKFRFRRSIFGGDEADFIETIDLINAMHSYEEATEYLIDDRHLDPENADVKDFLSIVANHFCV